MQEICVFSIYVKDLNMFNFKSSCAFRRSLLSLALATSTGLASAETLHIEVDTKNLGSLGSTGWIDLSFMSYNAKATPATATLFDFVGFDSGINAQTSGDVTGSLASGFNLSNLGLGADLFHSVGLGGKVSFNVDFTGTVDAAVNRVRSTLSVALYGADQTTLLGNGDAASGALVQLYWLPSSGGATPGTVTYQVFDTVASVGAPMQASPVPEPSAWLTMGVGLGLVALARRRKINAALAA